MRVHVEMRWDNRRESNMTKGRFNLFGLESWCSLAIMAISKDSKHLRHGDCRVHVKLVMPVFAKTR